MRIVISIIVIVLAGLLLLCSPFLVEHLPLHIHSDSFINNLAKHQLFALTVALLTIAVFIRMNPESRKLLRSGDLHTVAGKEKWLGINGRSSWLNNGLQLLVFISVATGIFMFLGVKQAQSLSNFQWWFVPVSLLFALTNSFSEEIIFRFGVVAGLEKYCSKLSILLVSAILFGLPHYFGSPSGPVGVIMAGVLGYILCKATIETRGLSIAWMIHFVQDVIIFIALLMINIKLTY
jgi:uncharacterized protein